MWTWTVQNKRCDDDTMNLLADAVDMAFEWDLVMLQEIATSAGDPPRTITTRSGHTIAVGARYAGSFSTGVLIHRRLADAITTIVHDFRPTEVQLDIISKATPASAGHRRPHPIYYRNPQRRGGRRDLTECRAASAGKTVDAYHLRRLQPGASTTTGGGGHNIGRALRQQNDDRHPTDDEEVIMRFLRGLGMKALSTFDDWWSGYEEEKTEEVQQDDHIDMGLQHDRPGPSQHARDDTTTERLDPPSTQQEHGAAPATPTCTRS